MGEKLLSERGRMTFICSFLSCISVYIFSMFRFPSTVSKTYEKITKDFGVERIEEGKGLVLCNERWSQSQWT